MAENTVTFIVPNEKPAIRDIFRKGPDNKIVAITERLLRLFPGGFNNIAYRIDDVRHMYIRSSEHTLKTFNNDADQTEYLAGIMNIGGNQPLPVDRIKKNIDGLYALTKEKDDETIDIIDRLTPSDYKKILGNKKYDELEKIYKEKRIEALVYYEDYYGTWTSNYSGKPKDNRHIDELYDQDWAYFLNHACGTAIKFNAFNENIQFYNPQALINHYSSKIQNEKDNTTGNDYQDARAMNFKGILTHTTDLALNIVRDHQQRKRLTKIRLRKSFGLQFPWMELQFKARANHSKQRAKDLDFVRALLAPEEPTQSPVFKPIKNRKIEKSNTNNQIIPEYVTQYAENYEIPFLLKDISDKLPVIKEINNNRVHYNEFYGFFDRWIEEDMYREGVHINIFNHQNVLLSIIVFYKGITYIFSRNEEVLKEIIPYPYALNPNYTNNMTYNRAKIAFDLNLPQDTDSDITIGQN